MENGRIWTIQNKIEIEYFKNLKSTVEVGSQI